LITAAAPLRYRRPHRRWWAEKYVGLVKVFAGLEALREKSPSLPQFQSCSLLKDIARSGSTINEELFYRQQQR